MPFPRSRFLLAYGTALQVFSSYLALGFLKKIFSEKRLQRRIQRTHLKNGKRILSTILQLKGLFIKVGQMISILTTFLPKEITEILEGLQDAVPPRPYPEIEKRFWEEFQKKPAELFLDFEQMPIASASLGQVHLAHLRDGSRVAVKVQYPEVDRVVKDDLKILKRIFYFLHFLFPNYGIKSSYQEVSVIVLQELNFLNEGKNLETIRDNFSQEPDFVFAKVYWEYSTEKILTLEFMEGIKISQLDLLQQAGIDPTVVATKIIHGFCKQIFIDGVYHADPHPGNFLVQPGPKIVMLDFGAVARISENMRKGVAKWIEGIIRRDNRMISQAMKEMGFIAKTENEEVFDRIVEFFYDRLKDLKLEDIKSLNLSEIGNIDDLLEFKKLDISFSELLQTFNVPKDWALLERALILLFALTTHLAPELNPLSIVIPYAEQFVLGKGKNLKDLILEAFKEVILSYLKLPAELHRTLRKLNQGEIAFHLKPTASRSPTLERSLHRLNLTLLCLSTALASYVLYREKIGGEIYPLVASGFLGAWLFGSFLKKK